MRISAVLRGMGAALADRDAAFSAVAEAALAEAFRGRAVLLVDSGTTALRLVLEGLCRDSPGRPVALPAYGCFDIAT